MSLFHLISLPLLCTKMLVIHTKQIFSKLNSFLLGYTRTVEGMIIQYQVSFKKFKNYTSNYKNQIRLSKWRHYIETAKLNLNIFIFKNISTPPTVKQTFVSSQNVKTLEIEFNK